MTEQPPCQLCRFHYENSPEIKTALDSITELMDLTDSREEIHLQLCQSAKHCN